MRNAGKVLMEAPSVGMLLFGGLGAEREEGG